MKINTIYNENCLETMAKMPDNFIDLTVTSPPYDNLRQYKGFIFSFEDIAKQLYRITKEGSVVVWLVGDAVINGSETGTSFKQCLKFMDIGFNLHDTMIWRKTNPMPKIKTNRYFDCFEYMFILSKGNARTFNPILKNTVMGGKSYNSTCKNMGGESGRTQKSFILNNEREIDNIWDHAIAQNKTEHPAVHPLGLVKDHVFTWSNESDLIYDPFMGSGTTAVAALKLNRNYIGSEISSEYCKISEKRIKDYTSQQVIQFPDHGNS